MTTSSGQRTNVTIIITATILAAFAVACGGAAPTEDTDATAAPSDGRLAPLLSGIGEHTHAVTSSDPMAQSYFDQGLVMHYAFNNAEARRAFWASESSWRVACCRASMPRACAWIGVAIWERRSSSTSIAAAARARSSSTDSMSASMSAIGV